MAAPAWEADALCSQIDPDIFSPEVNQGQAVTDAKTICGRCPSRLPCLAAALKEEGSKPANMRGSIRGGKTPRERYALHQKRKKEAA